MNVSSIVKAVGRFITEGPPRYFVTGEYVTLIKGHTIRRKDLLNSPRTYAAMSDVSFLLTDDPDQFNNIHALTLVLSPPETGPKPGETWRRTVRHSSDETFNFACVAHDDEDDNWFVWHASSSSDAFVISKDDFYADRHNWEQV